MKDIESRLVHNEEFTFTEAVKFFGERITITPKEFYKLSWKYRNLAFTVSGYTKAEIFNGFYDTLLKAIEDGTTMEQFREDMSSFLIDKGYEGLTNFQADNIYRTNIQTAYQVGHYDQMTDPDVLRLRPYWQYIIVDDSCTRPSHRAMANRVFRADSSVWDTWYPPNGFRCRCTVQTLSARQVEQMGLTVEDEAPERAEVGTQLVYVAPDPQFSTNPAKHRFKPDLSGYPEPLRRAYEQREQTNRENAP